MRIIYFGTPDFAIPPLQRLIDEGHDIAAVVTAPDKERGRGRKVLFTPIKKFALEHAIPVIQPPKLKAPEFHEELRSYNAELFVVVAFRILPETVFDMPKHGSFNLHGSLLPRYRGAAPMQWALINGDTETGVTTFRIAKSVDTGNVYLRKRVQIDPEDNLGTLHDKLSEVGAEAVAETVKMIESGNVELLPQNDEEATPAPKIQKEDTIIDFTKDARGVHNLIRGLSPIPGAYFERDGKVFKVYKTKVIEESGLAPGEIEETKKSLHIGCGTGALSILKIQQEGRKRLDIEAFLRGYSFTA